MDFTKLRAQALKSGEDEEAVTVNTRALIDKVLARYSGEWTTLRELIQNAADAQATTVKIKFETLPSPQVPVPQSTNESEILKHVLLNHTLKRLLVVNDGQPFGANDWSRLKRIAEGNPDETKIGAFGVGFYSVFADCEEPFVSSGKKAMAFFWKGNSLFTRRIQVPEQSPNSSTETNFVLDYRNSTSPVPNLLSICQFLATSLTFVALSNIELWLDDWKILSLQKKVSPSTSIHISRDFDMRTKEGLMTVQSLNRESVQIDASFMNVIGWKPSSNTTIAKPFGESQYGASSIEGPSLRSFFSRLTASSSQSHLKSKAIREEKEFQDIVLEDLTAITTANVFLRITTAAIRTSIASAFAAELERATKKPPPRMTRVAILTSSFDETTASHTVTKSDTVSRNVDIFASVLPGKTGGKIYIGFPTAQTVGAGMHLSAPSVIPTVERESIDLNARWVRTWNVEMLRVAGIMSRLTFTSEMSILSENINRAASDGRVTKDIIAKFLPEALHILKTFTFEPSTPSAQVAQIIEEAFWTTYKKPSIEIYSTKGVLPTTAVRFATDDFSGFVEGIPVVPESLAGSKFVFKLRDFGLITEITVGDVKKELGAKALTKDQLVHFISWAGRKAVTGDIDAATIHDLLDSAVATISDKDGQGTVIALSTIKYYRIPNKVPPEAPASPTTLSFEFTRSLSQNELEALGWEPLEIVPWLRFLAESTNGQNGLSSEHDITSSPKFAAQVLAILSKQWDLLSSGSKGSVVTLLKTLTVIPTKLGMKIPTDAYFPNVKLFDDLPTVSGCQGVKEKVLAALGVRKTVDLDTIFQRLLNPASNSGAANNEQVSPRWSHVELISYLASVKDDIPPDDLKKLRTTSICAAEAGPPGQEASQGTIKRYRISELFEPKESLRQLDLPILQWPGKIGYRAASPEGRFLTFLGLRSKPSVPELVNLMASTDVPTRSKAMNYFIANHHVNGYVSFDIRNISVAILPIQGDEKRLVAPKECYANEKASLLGFDILRRDLVLHANKFGIAENPPMTECVNRIIAKPPLSRHDAISLFGYFSSRLAEIGQNHALKLGDARIVPVTKSKETLGEKRMAEVVHVSPRMCFIGDSGNYRDIFDFVDFSTEANTFLLHCGSKHEPSRLQVAAMLASEPARVLGIVQSQEKYLSLLRTLADALPELKRDKNLYRQMKASPFLLATRQISGTAVSRSEKKKDDVDEDEDEEPGVQQLVLQPATKIVIVDDYASYRLFKEVLLCAPLEESLENFYLSLGASNISSLVQDDVRLGSVLPDRTDLAHKIQKRILERSKLFLHDFPHETIRHDARWLEKNLTVEMVSGISLKRSLRGYSVSHTAKQTATLTHDPRKGWVLWITSTHDMYHVSQALVSQILTRPNNQATVTLELLLTSDLQGLKRRGYNVDRILRAQATEARIAEGERQKQLEAEQKQIKEQEELWKQSQRAQAAVVREDKRKTGQASMPGAFGNDSPEGSPPPEPKRTKGLFSGLTRRLGLDTAGDAHQQYQNFLGGGPSRNAEQEQGNAPSYEESQAAVSQTKSTGKSVGDTEKVTSPHAVHQNLLNAVQASRAHNSSSLFSPPQTNQVKEQGSYCDAKPSHNITQVGDARNGMKIYISKELTLPATTFLSQNANSINSFASLLYEVGDIYSLPHRALHMFYDESGSTIAFNAQGSIFCNLRFFNQLHASKISTPEGKVESSSWWWIVVAHELAHNLVSDHSAEHSYYTEMFVAQYFSKMMQRAISYTQAIPESRQTESQPQSLLD